MRIFESDTRLFPFGDPIAEIPLLGRSVARLREEEILRSRVDGQRLTFADYALATAPLLAAFAARAPAGRPSALALPAHSASAALAPVSSVRKVEGRLIYDVFLDAPGSASLEALRAEATPVEVALPERTRVRHLPRLGPPPHVLALPANGALAVHLEHWVHLLWAGPLLVPALAAARPGKKRRWPKARAPSWIGRGATIHPSAFVEGSVIGEGVEIGPGSVIRHSYVGDGSRLSDFTKLSHTVLGEGTHTLADATFEEVVTLGGGTLTSLRLEDTILGKNVFLTTGVIFWNQVLEGTATVLRDGREVDTGRKLLGGCAGHGSILGARTIVGPGRALPNRTTVVMRKSEAVARIAAAAPGTPMCWSDGALVPVTEVLPGYLPEELDLRDGREPPEAPERAPAAAPELAPSAL